MGSGPSKGTVATIAVVAIVAGLSIGYATYLNGGTLDFSDTEAKIVVSGSMDGQPRDYPISTIPTGSLVVIHRATGSGFYSSLEVGDVLTFDYVHPVSKESMVVTHRITSISESAGVYTYTLKGDSIADDPTNGSVQTVTSSSGDIVGEVVGVSHWLGVLAVFMSTWTGKFCLVLIPCVILIVSEVRNIVRILRQGDEKSDEVSMDGSTQDPEPAPQPDWPAFVTAEERKSSGGVRVER